MRSQAEIARRKVMLESAERNLAAVAVLREKHPEIKRAELELEDTRFCEDMGQQYRAAVEADDYEQAFVLAEWLHGSTVELRTFAETLAAKIAAGA